MSGDGDCRQRKQDDDLQSTDQDIETEETQPPQRPMTAGGGARRRTPFNSQSDPTDAARGERPSYTRNLNDQEKRIGGQAQKLLEMFIYDRMQRDTFEQSDRNRVQTAVCPDVQQEKQKSQGHNEDYLDDVSLALRDIGDQLTQDYELNSLIDKVPIQSPKAIFVKVCKQMFADGQFNWGRVVALFYFAYRLMAKAVVSAVDSIPWIKEIFSWAIDFFCQYVAWWIIQRGGWRMIREYWGPSSRSLTALGVTAVCTVLYVWWKQQ